MESNWKRNTALFIIGQTITVFGSSIVQYAILWNITLTTQSGIMMTLISLVGFLPMFIISPIGGVWADRFDRKRLIVIADGIVALASLIVAILLMMDLTYISVLLVCTGVRALGQGVQMPAVGAVIPQIVPTEHLTRVNGIHGSVQSLSYLLAPMLGALLMSYFSLQTLFFFDVITASIGIGILLFLVNVPHLDTQNEKSGVNYFRDMKEGLLYVKNNGFVLRLLIYSALYMIFATPAALLTPLQVVRNFGDDVWRLSAIEIAFSVGMMIGGLVIAAWGGFKNRILTMTFGLILFGLTVIGLGLASDFWVYLGIFVLTGMVMPFFNTPVMVILQTKVEQDYMGRILSVFTMVSTSIMPLAMLAFGPIVDIVSIDTVLVFTGIIMVMLSILLVCNGTLRNAGLLEDA